MDTKFEVNQRVQGFDTTNGHWSPAIILEITRSHIILNFYRCSVKHLRELKIDITRVSHNPDKWPIREEQTLGRSRVKDAMIVQKLPYMPDTRVVGDLVFAEVSSTRSFRQVEQYAVAINDPFNKALVLVPPTYLEDLDDFNWETHINSPVTLYSELRSHIPRSISPPAPRRHGPVPASSSSQRASIPATHRPRGPVPASSSSKRSDDRPDPRRREPDDTPPILGSPAAGPPLPVVTLTGRQVCLTVCANGILSVNDYATFNGSRCSCKGQLELLDFVDSCTKSMCYLLFSGWITCHQPSCRSIPVMFQQLYSMSLMKRSLISSPPIQISNSN